jgi:6-phosphogluconolactonase
MALSRDGSHLYAVQEGVPSGQVHSYLLTPKGWEKDGCLPSGGSAPCHVALNEKNQTLAVANYFDGVVRLYSLDGEGALHSIKQTIQMEGHGVNPARQECAHAHQCTFIGNEMLACDLGTDTVRSFLRDADGLYAEQEPALHVAPGAGPRHLVLADDGSMLYLLCELSNQLYAFRNARNGWQEEGAWSILPPNTSSVGAAALRLSDNGRFLFASNRGYDSVAMFELDEKTKLPALCGIFPCGAFPRDILPVGNYLLCACQKADKVQAMAIDPEHKALRLTSETAVPRPVCLLRA